MRVISTSLIGLICLLSACSPEPKTALVKGTINSIECENVWRSSNVLKAEIVDSNVEAKHFFSRRLRDMDCKEISQLMGVGTKVKFRYKSGGYKKSIVTELFVKGRWVR